MSGGAAGGRLAEERKLWRKNHPFGFIAKPEAKKDGSVNLMCWKCFIPGKEGTDWEGGLYPITLHFSQDYPIRPPGWKPSITMKQILLGIQDLLNQPNPSDAANFEPNQLFIKDPAEYKRRVQLEAKKYPPTI
ncbi:hypothetical protein PIB30_003245 [Stylosanthes scabra]|uniref:UBC core domain-containing protein n=1 Tax=Stylosanthes scabra TaxID=79078 RepID=A0ABU6R3T2_9FABA|nr:hypothetical protein [Stylosanthes scabra]